jgi:hypothetical protein
MSNPEGQPLRSEDFFMVESVGVHPTGLIVTGLIEHNRQEPLRLSRFRPATEVEIASQGK